MLLNRLSVVQDSLWNFQVLHHNKKFLRLLTFCFRYHKRFDYETCINHKIIMKTTLYSYMSTYASLDHFSVNAMTRNILETRNSTFVVNSKILSFFIPSTSHLTCSILCSMMTFDKDSQSINISQRFHR